MKIALGVLPWALWLAYEWFFTDPSGKRGFGRLNKLADDIAHTFKLGETWVWQSWFHHRLTTVIAGLIGGLEAVIFLGLPFWFGVGLGFLFWGVGFYMPREALSWRRDLERGRKGQWLWDWPRVGWGWDGIFDIPWGLIVLGAWLVFA